MNYVPATQFGTDWPSPNFVVQNFVNCETKNCCGFGVVGSKDYSMSCSAVTWKNFRMFCNLQVLQQAAVLHELGDDVDGFLHGADGVKLNQFRMT